MSDAQNISGGQISDNLGLGARQRGILAGEEAARTRPAGKMRPNTATVRMLYAALTLFCDFAAIMVSAAIAGWLYHQLAYDRSTAFAEYLQYGYAVAFLVVFPAALRGEYTIKNYLQYRGHLRRVALYWMMAFITALALAFLTKTSADISRGSAVLFFVGGFGALAGIRLVLVRIVQEQAATGQAANRRVFVVGFEEDIRVFNERYEPWRLGIDIVYSAILRSEESMEDDLALAAAAARVLRPEDIFILTPWSNKQTIEACINSFLSVPASIYLGPDKFLDRFADMNIEKFGAISSLNVIRKPLSLVEILQKRALDIMASASALVLLSPLFAVVALLIKLDSKGPVFFLQRRYGFNQEPFRIFKFRSMSSMDDGRIITQAKQNDVRITRIGRFLRRTNIDELPQLFNVLRGNMSLVGPRPHALAHDQMFESQIAQYARRHNVKPGITGWAQVNGLRGETDTKNKMLARVDHDLYYIDHWSIWLDIRILFLTVFSRKAYRNAV